MYYKQYKKQEYFINGEGTGEYRKGEPTGNYYSDETNCENGGESDLPQVEGNYPRPNPKNGYLTFEFSDGWQDVYYYLRFTKYSTTDKNPLKFLEYSYDGEEWTRLAKPDDFIYADEMPSNKIMFRGERDWTINNDGGANHFYFMSGDMVRGLKISGNPMSLVIGDKVLTEDYSDVPGFYLGSLFADCYIVSDASELYLPVLSPEDDRLISLSSMFRGCKNLIVAPRIPRYTYMNNLRARLMFDNCNRLRIIECLADYNESFYNTIGVRFGGWVQQSSGSEWVKDGLFYKSKEVDFPYSHIENYNSMGSEYNVYNGVPPYWKIISV